MYNSGNKVKSVTRLEGKDRIIANKIGNLFILERYGIDNYFDILPLKGQTHFVLHSIDCQKRINSMKIVNKLENFTKVKALIVDFDFCDYNSVDMSVFYFLIEKDDKHFVNPEFKEHNNRKIIIANSTSMNQREFLEIEKLIHKIDNILIDRDASKSITYQIGYGSKTDEKYVIHINNVYGIFDITHAYKIVRPHIRNCSVTELMALVPEIDFICNTRTIKITFKNTEPGDKRVRFEDEEQTTKRLKINTNPNIIVVEKRYRKGNDGNLIPL